MPKFEVGDHVAIIGIVYENGELEKSLGKAAFQTADGQKHRHYDPEALQPASAEQAEAFKAVAVEGLNPEAIIAREAAETEEELKAKAKADAEDPGDEDPEDED